MITPDDIQVPSTEEANEAEELLEAFFAEVQIDRGLTDACAVFYKYEDKLEAAAKLAATLGPKGLIVSAGILAVVGIFSGVCTLGGAKNAVIAPSQS